MSDTLKTDQTLRAGQELVSANGQSHLVMQSDGNLVIYTPHGPVWDTKTWNMPPSTRPTYFILQSDGNLVLYNDTGFVGWSPNVYGKGGTHLVMQDDEN